MAKKLIADEKIDGTGKLLAAVGDPKDDDYGYVWRVQVHAYGPGGDGRINWPREPLVAAFPLIDGARVFALNESQHQAGTKPFGKSVREIVGWLKTPQDTGDAVEADFYILKSAKWLRDALVDSHERGAPDLLGLSFDARGKTVTRMVAGKKMIEPTEISSVEVDVVYRPTNNGKFLRMAAASGQDNPNHEEDEMDFLQKLLAAYKKVRPDDYQTIDAETVTVDEMIEKLSAAAVADAGGDNAGNDRLVAALTQVMKDTLQTGESEELRQMRLMAANMTLDRALTDSKLLEKAAKIIRGRFENTVFEPEKLQAAIREQKELIDDMTGSGNVSGAGGVRVGRDSTEKLQAACDQMFGVNVAEDMRTVPMFRSIRAAYVEITGDSEIRGFLDPGQRMPLQAAYGSATFAYVLGNTLYRKMISDYGEISDYGVSRLVGSNIRNAVDFRTMESVRIGYYGDLPDVNPEDNDFADLGEVSDEKVEYALNQKGGIITITRKMIINDDMRAVQKIISRLPRSARRTLAKRCWNKFIGNAVYGGDSKTVFHADHGNLGSSAYAIASALAARTAMAQQTEPDSGERIMLRPVTVAFPSELFGVVTNVNTYNPQAAAIADANPMFNFFKPEGLVECPFMTDTNDWMMFADPNECEILELAYLNGQREPEMFVADQPTVGQMFVADKIQYKIRHEYECEIADFRGAYKAVVG